ncbi:MAG: preprotein translocase subunit YajC [Phycisphaerae bacterium]|nr:preprotein translocase subunit YajC [Phycisphaerae bacterium]
MPSRTLIALMLAACVALAASASYAQTTKPARPMEGEELTGVAKPAGEPASQPTETPPEPQKEAPPSRPFDRYLLPVMLGVLLLLLFWSSRSRKKQEAKRQQMLAALKKGDKVTSVGGVIGTIIEVRDDEVVVKVDETNNVRMRFARWSIRGTGDQAKTEAPEQRK